VFGQVKEGQLRESRRIEALGRAPASSARNLTITLKAPDGKSAAGQFDEANAAAFLEVLKRSGLTAA
jgi:hypothetical protein